MKKHILICITIGSLLLSNGFAQKSKIVSADKKYDSYAHIDAIKTYQKVAEKGYKSEDIFKKLANSFYFNSEFEKGAKWYGELFSMNIEAEPEYYYRYAQCLKATGDTAKAKQILDLFKLKLKNESKVKLSESTPNSTKDGKPFISKETIK
ncbi:hypothetical protein CFS9_39910 [Flavobacterium sp. CFS9]|uniref:Flagellar motor protein MotB n=1 Tax=Flavobacterium sp. CFS9 TaxID=3143118 RepID=A0AAT9H7B6_9FLAO